jgi:hypothetical protein
MAETNDTIDAGAEPVYRVLEAFSFDEGGRPWVMRKGDLVTPSHPAFAGREGLLERVDDDVVRRQTMSVSAANNVRATETASAAPGQRRAVSSPPAPEPPSPPAPEPPSPPAPEPPSPPAPEPAKAKGKGRVVADSPQA